MKRRTIVLGPALLALMAILWLGSGVMADGPAGGGDVPLAVTVPHRISYQGQANDNLGNPLNGNFDMVFELWNAATGGNMVDSGVQYAVPVSNGLFSTWFSVNPYNCFNGQALWLQVKVAGQTVSPRQELLAVPYAWCALGGLGFPFEGTDNTPDPTFSIVHTAAGVAIRGLATSTANVTNYGGYFEAHGTTGRAVAGVATDGIGVYGESAGGNGVSGFTTSDNQWVPAIYGRNEGAGDGVYGWSKNRHGTYGVTSSSDPTHAGVFATNHGVGPGIYAEAGSDGYAAIFKGTTKTDVLEITGGADLSEEFDIRGRDSISRPCPGMVVSIDSQNPGDLIVSDRAYDRRVAGVISGARGVQPGMLMGQKGSKADGSNPVALTGRVYCWADASNGQIAPGDLLTTSDAPGHAMKVTDYARAQGAILGKAMTGLTEGKGLVLVLVALQ